MDLEFADKTFKTTWLSANSLGSHIKSYQKCCFGCLCMFCDCQAIKHYVIASLSPFAVGWYVNTATTEGASSY